MFRKLLEIIVCLSFLSNQIFSSLSFSQDESIENIPFLSQELRCSGAGWTIAVSSLLEPATDYLDKFKPFLQEESMHGMYLSLYVREGEVKFKFDSEINKFAIKFINCDHDEILEQLRCLVDIFGEPVRSKSVDLIPDYPPRVIGKKSQRESE